MRFDARITKEGRHWLAEVAALDLLTQGRSRKEAESMLVDGVETLVGRQGFRAQLRASGEGRYVLGANDADRLVALMLRRQREKYGLTLMQVAQRLGATSPNAFARYEQGRARPTLSKLVELIEAIDPKLTPVLVLAT